MKATSRRYRMAVGVALVFALTAGALLAACGAANTHQLGEVCSPYAVGVNPPDGGNTNGDCVPGLACVCPFSGGSCTCANGCEYTDAGAFCQQNLSCQSARNGATGQTGNYCVPGDGGA